MKKNKRDGQFSTHNAQRKTLRNNALLTFFNRTRVCVISYGSPYEKKDTGERMKQNGAGILKHMKKKNKEGYIKHNAELCAHNALLTFFNRTRVCVISYGSPYEKERHGRNIEEKRSGNTKTYEKEEQGGINKAQRRTLRTQCTFDFFNRTHVCVISYGSPYEKK